MYYIPNRSGNAFLEPIKTAVGRKSIHASRVRA
jgi:hypothetical protein